MRLGKSVGFACALVASFATIANADDSEIVLMKARALTDMEYQSKKLQIQAVMAESIDKMVKAGVLVAEDGTPLGVGSIAQLAAEVRQRSQASPQLPNPFDTTGPQFPVGTPAAAPAQPPVSVAPDNQQAARGQAPKEEEAAIPGPTKGDHFRLLEIRSNYIVLQNGPDRTKLALGQSVNGYKLTKISGDTADLSKDGQTKQLAIRW